jgi:osmotically-inducible protein OsmY
MHPSSTINCATNAALPNRNPTAEKEAVLAEARLRFEQSPYRELHDIACEFQDGVMTLRGRVPSCFLKQIAQSTVFSMERVEVIDNRLEVAEA